MNTKTNWTDSDDLAIMFNATYPADFYKKLQRFVHHKFRRNKALEEFKTKGNWKALLQLSYRIPQTLYSQIRIHKYVS
jgi:hypothetical protein